MRRIVERTDDICPFKLEGYYPMSFGEVVHWCETHCTADFRVGFTKVAFESEDDAMLFLLSMF